MENFDILSMSETENGVEITVFAPKYIREKTIEKLSKKHKREYLESINDTELLSLVTAKDKGEIIGKVLERERKKLGFNNIKLINRNDLPSDRYFREAWKPDLTIDMDKARIIHMGRIRRARNEKLKLTDIEYLKALEAAGYTQSETVDAIKNKRQSLRDIPQTFDLSQANTPEELRAMWPEALS